MYIYYIHTCRQTDRQADILSHNFYALNEKLSNF